MEEHTSKREWNDLGRIEIAPEVIQIISGLSASQVEGVSGMSGGMVGDISQLLGRKNVKQGIRVELDEQITRIELSVVVHYGYYLPEVGQKIQESVKSAVEMMTGLTVDQIVVRIEGVRFPQSGKQTDAESTNRLK